MRLLYATWKVKVLDPCGAAEGFRDATSPAIMAFWHRHILSILAHFRGSRVCVPVSESRDGEYVAQVMRRFGAAAARGSSSRGGLGAVKGLLAHAREGWSLAITPDGPRGPRYSVGPGVTLLARRSGLPILPVGVAVRSAWVARSWDAFVIPKPGTRVVLAFDPALTLDEAAYTQSRCAALQEAIFAATRRAREALAG